MMWKRLWLREKGQSMIEMAFVMPILIVIMMGITTFGIAINSKIAVSGAAREAARAYAITRSPGQAQVKAKEFLKGGIVASNSEFNKNFNPSSDVKIENDGNYVTVTVTYHQPVYVPGLMTLLGGDQMADRMQLKSSATFKMEG
jgi:Flp pilus assembly protein TadG